MTELEQLREEVAQLREQGVKLRERVAVLEARQPVFQATEPRPWWTQQPGYPEKVTVTCDTFRVHPDSVKF